MKKWIEHFRQKGIPSVYSENSGTTGGCGFAKNCCVKQSHGKYLCFQDADDVMYPERIAKQVEVLKEHPNAIVGTYFEYFLTFEFAQMSEESQRTACVTTRSG